MPRILIVISLIFGMACGVAKANFNGSDDFTGTTFSSNWGATMSGGGGALSQSNRVIFTVSGGGGTDAWAVKPWTNNFGSYTESWSVQIDTYRSSSVGLSVAGQSLCNGLIVMPTAGAGPGGAAFDAYMDYYLDNIGGGSFKGFTSSLMDTNGITVGEHSVSASATVTGAVRIVFDAATKTLTGYYDADGPSNGYSWTPIYSASVTNWGMSNSDTFLVLLYASSGSGTNGAVYAPSAGNLTLDNFQAGSLAGGGDVAFHIVAGKGASLMQTNAAGPLVTPMTDPAWFFLSSVQPTSGTDSVSAVTLRTPAGNTFSLPYSGGEYNTNAGFASKTALDASFPNGTYTQTIYAVHDGTRSVPMTLLGDVYPNDPVVTNWTAAQTLDMTGGFTLQWTNFVGGTSNDHIQVEVKDSNGNTVFFSGDPGRPGSLNGTATSLQIPAGTFAPGTNYTARLLFAKVLGVTNAFPNVVGVVTYLKQNLFPINTVSQPDLAYFDGFQSFANGDSLLDAWYIPVVGAYTAFHSETGMPSATVTNLSGNHWALLDCSGAPVDLKVKCAPSAPLTNQIITLRWNLWIQSTNSGFGAFSVNLPFAPDEYNPPLVFLDQGVIAVFTNAPSPDQAIVIGNWSAFADTVMTNELVLNFPNRTMSYSLNGQMLTNMPLSAYWTNLVDAVVFAVNEEFPTSLGNRFALDDIKITATGLPVPDAQDFVLAKGAFYAQTNTAPPVFRYDTPFAFLAEVTEQSSGTVASAAIQVPGSGLQPLTRQPGEDLFALRATFATTNLLDASYPNGTYTFTIVGVHDATNQPVLNLTGNLYPNAPHLSNWSAAQNIVATNDFVLTWDTFSGGTTGDYIKVSIEDVSGNIIFRTPEPGAPGALTGTNTSVTIPANTLIPGRNYYGYVLFAKVISVDSTGYPGVTGFSAYFAETTFPLITAAQDSVGDGIPDWWRALYFGGDGTTTNSQSCATADPDGDGMSNYAEYLAGTVPTSSASALRITGIAQNGNDMNITWNVVTGRTYLVQTSTNLVTDSFNNPSNTVATIYVPLAPPITTTNFIHQGAATNVPSRFYRVRLQTP